MNTALNVTDMYMSVLSSLPNDEKLDLIAKLTDSMRKKGRTHRKRNVSDIFARFHDDWGGKGTPEEIAEGLRKSRVFTRQVEVW